MSALLQYPPVEAPILPEPPDASNAEMALLGSMLMSASAYHAVAGRLDAAHFGNAFLGEIYEAISARIDAGATADPITISRLFATHPGYQDAGGVAYIQALARGAGITFAAPDYADVIIDTWRRREIIRRAWAAIHDAAEPVTGRDALAVAQELETGLSGLADERGSGGDVVTIREAMVLAQQATEQAVKRGGAGGLATGLHTIDDRTGGLFPGHLVVIGGRPGQGKTALGQTIASNVAMAGGPVAFFSLEMGRIDIGWREHAAQTGINTGDQMRGVGGNDAVLRQGDAITEMADVPFFVFDRGGIGLAEVQRQSRMIQRRHGLALVVVDHLQLMRTRGQTENRRLELGAISGGLKALAKELGVPVMALSQLSRGVEGRDDKRPVMSDLRETGDIEQDADCVWMVYREEYYLKLNPPAQKLGEAQDKFEERYRAHTTALIRCAGIGEILMPKLRFGATGSVRLKFSGERSRFADLSDGNW